MIRDSGTGAWVLVLLHVLLWSHYCTLRKFWRYNKASLRELVLLEILGSGTCITCLTSLLVWARVAQNAKVARFTYLSEFFESVATLWIKNHWIKQEVLCSRSWMGNPLFNEWKFIDIWRKCTTCQPFPWFEWMDFLRFLVCFVSQKCPHTIF